MIESQYLIGINDKGIFSKKELLESFRLGGYSLSEASFNKKVNKLVQQGDLVRVGRNLYHLNTNNTILYKYAYSTMAEEVAEKISNTYPLLEFSIFELTQLNDFVNHQIAHNVIYVSVEKDAINFVFETLKKDYPGKVLIDPTVEIYHKYWNDNMIVLTKLVTEAPKDKKINWHIRIEKMLIDIIAEPVIAMAIGKSEYPIIIKDSFEHYSIDEDTLFRYGDRRKANKKLLKIIEEADVKLYTKGENL